MGLPDFEALWQDYRELIGEAAGPLPAALPSWACSELVATEAARKRLRAWAAAGSQPATAEEIVRGLRYIGDPELLGLVQTALLERLPAPAARYILEHFMVVATGASSGGFCARLAAPEGPLLRMTVLSGASRDAAKITSYFLHEASHAWLEPDPARPLKLEAVASETAYLALITAEGNNELAREFEAEAFEAELRADALGLRWGARREDLDSAHGFRQHNAAEGARLLETYGPQRSRAQGRG